MKDNQKQTATMWIIIAAATLFVMSQQPVQPQAFGFKNLSYNLSISPELKTAVTSTLPSQFKTFIHPLLNWIYSNPLLFIGIVAVLVVMMWGFKK